MSHDIEHCEASSVTVFSDLSNLTILFFFFWRKRKKQKLLYIVTILVMYYISC